MPGSLEDLVDRAGLDRAAEVDRGNFDLTSFRWVDQIFRSRAYPIYREPSGGNLYQNYG